MKKTHAAITAKGSPLNTYKDVMVGSRSWRKFLYYEWCMLLAPVPGALGMVLRKIFWPGMFASCGKGCLFASGITVRQPEHIHLGRSVIISETCILDGRHDIEQMVVVLGNNVILSNGVMISCKNGRITIGDNTGINAFAIVQSTNGCVVSIGNDCILGQRSLVIGGGNYNMDRLDIPIREQGIKNDGGVILEDNVWLGANTSVLGGVTMASGSVAATGAVITRSVEKNSVNMGVPARTVHSRAS
jgi:galactoside O-acetyltransferase